MSLRALPRVNATTGALATLRQVILHNHRAPLDWIVRLSETDDSRHDLLGYADVHEEDVVLGVMNDPVQQLHQLGVSHSREAALEHGKLKPFSKSFHEPEDPTPTLGIRYVVGDDVEVLVPHEITAS